MPPSVAEIAALEKTVQRLAPTVLAMRETVRPELAETAVGPGRGPSPFLSRAPVLPPAHVRMPDSAAEGAHDIEVTRLLAEGGMGRVYLAEQRSLAREVVIKAVKVSGDPGQTDALLWEGAIMGHLDHPGVTPVHLLGAAPDGSPLLVMKRIVGLPWSELLLLPDPSARVGTLPKDRLRAHVEILMEIARTLHHAHQRGVVHLDLKPDNVMIGELGEVYLVDWGIATTLERAAVEGAALAGTPAFIAPEVVRGGSVGPWTDVYLLGATLHNVLTGRPRHEGEGLSDVLKGALASEPVAYDAGVPRELGALANAATSRDPEARPRDALAFRAALAEYLEHAASLALSADGTARLDELRREGDASKNTGSARSVRLVTEARFAFRAALDRWAENPDARRGLAEAHEATAHLEIARENLAGAKEAAAELGATPEGLAARIAELEERLRRRAESEAALSRVEKEQDLETGARARYVAILILCAIVIVVTVLLGGLEPLDPALFEKAPPEQLLAIPVAMTVVVTVGVLGFGRSLLSNTIGRRLAAMFMVGPPAMALHRGVLLIARSPMIHGVLGDMFIAATLMTGLAIFVSPRVWIAVGFCVAGAVAAALWPPYTTAAFNGASVLAIACIAWALNAARKQRARERVRVSPA